MGLHVKNRVFILAKKPRGRKNKQSASVICIGTLDEIKKVNPDIKILKTGEIIVNERDCIII